jgi:hypothetical protein
MYFFLPFQTFLFGYGITCKKEGCIYSFQQCHNTDVAVLLTVGGDSYTLFFPLSPIFLGAEVSGHLFGFFSNFGSSGSF